MVIKAQTNPRRSRCPCYLRDSERASRASLLLRWMPASLTRDITLQTAIAGFSIGDLSVYGRLRLRRCRTFGARGAAHSPESCNDCSAARYGCRNCPDWQTAAISGHLCSVRWAGPQDIDILPMRAPSAWRWARHRCVTEGESAPPGLGHFVFGSAADAAPRDPSMRASRRFSSRDRSACALP